MPRLIDADALKENIDVYFADSYSLIDSVHEMVDAMPTIEERKTGKWIRGDAEKLTGSQRCSICHKACYKGHDYFNYCPNCGSRMER